MNMRTDWPQRLQDARSRQVVFLSHCLLNANTRYLGGARRPGVIREITDPLTEQGIGIVQLPCPEQHAWGGVNKRFMLRFFGSENSLLFHLRPVLLPFMIAYTRLVYRRLARMVVKQMQDYVHEGYTIRGIVGVDGSPSCGVLQAMNIRRALEKAARLDAAHATDKDMNVIVRETIVPGRGLFVECLQREMRRRGLEVPFLAHSLLDELDDKIKPLVLPKP